MFHVEQLFRICFILDNMIPRTGLSCMVRVV